MSAPSLYPDPRGELELRREIAAYLALARGIECTPPQIIITGGFSGGLGLALRVLGLDRKKVWVEDPGFPFTRHGLELASLSIVPIPVDAKPNRLLTWNGEKIRPECVTIDNGKCRYILVKPRGTAEY